jgi:uncharacterized membrane protein
VQTIEEIRRSMAARQFVEAVMYIGGGILGTVLVVLLIIYIARRV